MPDASGKFKGIALSGAAADAWLRIFGQDAEPPLFSRQPDFDEIIPPLKDDDEAR